MRLRAKKSKSKYKNTDRWIDAVYRANKAFIDERLENLTNPKQSKKTVFKNLVNEYIDEGLAPVKALNTLSKTTIFTDVKDRLHSNVLTALKNENLDKEFRKLAGWKNKFDPDKLVWDKDEKIYVYDNKVMINFKNSPYGIELGVI